MAAPYNVGIESFEEFSDLLSIENELQNTVNITLTSECLRNAIEKVIEDNNLSQLLENVRQRLRAAVQRLRDCTANDDPEAVGR